MKKFSLFLGLLMLSVCMFAQEVNVKPLKSFSTISNKEKLNVQSNLVDKSLTREVATSSVKVENIILPNSLVENATRASFEVAYARPYGSYALGIEDGSGWFTFSTIKGAPFIDWTFEPYSTATGSTTFSWAMGTTSLAQDNNGVASQSFWGVYETNPVLTGVSGGASATFMIGDLSESGQGMLDAGIGYTPISSADPGLGAFGNFTDSDFYWGSGYQSGGKKATGVVAVFNEPMSPLYVTDVKAFVVPVEENKAIIPAGVELTVGLYKIANGQITDELVASGKATSGNVTPLTSESNISVITFQFIEEEDGFPIIYNADIDCAVAVIIEGIENANLRVLFARNDGFGGSAYVLLEDGKLETLPFSNSSAPAYDIHIVLTGVYPTLFIDESNDVVKIPAAGGSWGVSQTVEGQDYNDVALYTTLPLLDENGNDNLWFASELPSWIDMFDYDDDLYEEMGVIAFFFGAQEAHEGRAAKVTFQTHAGVSRTITIIQGDGGVGIESNLVEKINVIRTNDGFSLSYPRELNSVEILNVSGQLVGRYDLDNSGTYFISTTSLANGVYLLKFNGQSSATVKILK